MTRSMFVLTSYIHYAARHFTTWHYTAVHHTVMNHTSCGIRTTPVLSTWAEAAQRGGVAQLHLVLEEPLLPPQGCSDVAWPSAA